MKNFGVLILLSLLINGCQFALRTSIVPGARADNLTFEVSEYSGNKKGINIAEFFVCRCSDYAAGERCGDYINVKRYNGIWGATTNTIDHLTTGNRIKYGEAKNELVTRVGPEPLEPGCYVVRGYARLQKKSFESGHITHMGFNVNDDGSVEELSDSEYQSLLHQAHLILEKDYEAEEYKTMKSGNSGTAKMAVYQGYHLPKEQKTTESPHP